MFTGEPLDANGLVYLRARYYHPGLGVFTGLDPVENLNRYQYVSSNPVNYTDLSGLVEIRPGAKNCPPGYQDSLPSNCQDTIRAYEVGCCCKPDPWHGCDAYGTYYIATDAWKTYWQGQNAKLPSISTEEAIGILTVAALTVAGAGVAWMICGPAGTAGVVSNVAGNALWEGYNISSPDADLALEVGKDILVGGVGGCLMGLMPSHQKAAQWVQKTGLTTRISPNAARLIRATWAGGSNALQGTIGRLLDDPEAPVLSLQTGYDFTLGFAFQNGFDWLSSRLKNRFNLDYLDRRSDTDYKWIKGQKEGRGVPFGAKPFIQDQKSLHELRQLQRISSRIDLQALGAIVGTNTLGFPIYEVLGFVGEVTISPADYVNYMMCPIQ
jgi:RHS repeat-associated protein